jgi:hypothetical protein
MRYSQFLFFAFLTPCLLYISGCATAKPSSYKDFYAHPPRSILIVPVMNETADISAPKMHITSISRPLGERGYYVFPVLLTEALFVDLGLPEAGLIHNLPPQEFYNRFGADAVLFITIKDWSSKYIVLQNTRSIQARYLLVDTRTGTPLWDRTETFKQGSGGNSLLEAAINAAIDKVVTEMFDSQYRPLSTNLNWMTVTKLNSGLPFGPYHPEYGEDKAQYPE